MVKQLNQGNGLIGFVAGLCSPSQSPTKPGAGGGEITTCHVVMTGGCALCIACSLGLPAPPHTPPGPWMQLLVGLLQKGMPKETGIGTSQCHMSILEKKYLYSSSQPHECLFHDDSKQTRNLFDVSASTVHQLHCCHCFRFG